LGTILSTRSGSLVMEKWKRQYDIAWADVLPRYIGNNLVMLI
jgi:hypothetical protein